MAYELQTRRPWWYNNQRPRDEHCGPVERGSLMQLVPEAITQDPSVGCFFLDDFFRAPATANGWTCVEDGTETGTPGVQNARNGVYRKYTDGEDDDQFIWHTTAEMFRLEAGKHLWWECKVTLTEVSGVTANYIFGLSENVALDHLQNAGGGPPATYDGMCWYKLDSNMFLEFETSLAGAQVEWSDAFAHVSGVTYRLGAWCVPATATTFTVYPWYSIGTARGVLATAQAQTLTLTGHGEMQAFFGCKTGDVGGATEEYIDIDYFWVAQQR